MPRTYTAAERRLISDLAARGITARPEHVRRLRDLGLLPAVNPEVGYDPDQCAAILETTARARSETWDGWSKMAAVLFAEGCDVPRDPVVRAFSSVWESLTDDVPDDVDPDDVPDYLVRRDRVQTKRSALGRQWIERTGEYGAREGGTVEAAVQSILSLILGTETAQNVNQAALAKAAGIGADIAENAIALMEAIGNREIILATLEDSSLEDLQRARELTNRYVLDVAYLTDPAVLDEHPGLTGVNLIGVWAPRVVSIPIVNVICRFVPGVEEALENDIMY